MSERVWEEALAASRYRRGAENESLRADRDALAETLREVWERIAAGDTDGAAVLIEAALALPSENTTAEADGFVYSEEPGPQAGALCFDPTHKTPSVDATAEGVRLSSQEAWGTNHDGVVGDGWPVSEDATAEATCICYPGMCPMGCEPACPKCKGASDA